MPAARVAALPGVAPQLLAAVIGELDVGIAVAGADGRLTLVNEAFPALFGLPVGGDLTDPLGRALPDICAALVERGADAAAEALSWPPPAHPLQLRLPGGRSLNATWHPLDDEAWVLVVRDVTMQAQIRRRLRDHNRALAEKVAEKTELVAALCHELRTPLTSTNTMLGLLPEGDAFPGHPELGDLLDVVRRNATRIGDVVDELSTLNALEQGSVGLDLRPVDPAVLLREAVDAWNTRPSDAPPVTLAIHGRATITADPTWLTALVERLLSVAVASAGGVAVHVDASAGDDGWLVKIPLHEQLTSNRLFTTTGGARTSTALMLARAVVTRHGGTLRVGGAFELHLPLEAPADPRS